MGTGRRPVHDPHHRRAHRTDRNAGPAFAAVAIAFGNDPAILAGLTGVLLVGLAVELPFASWLARRRTADRDRTSERAAAADVELVELGATREQRAVPAHRAEGEAR
ncbi:hypothetical protein BJF90_19555 [Pseudonocardia sp. CNS-004]|nr:hypothetical protein BJF90_19555 [Pseudonocardia sp. CNS-004]